MRAAGMIVLLVVGACSLPNPVFGLLTESALTDSGDATTTSTPLPTTSATTSGDVPTTDQPATTTVDPPTTSATTQPVDPDTTTTDPISSTTDIVTTTGEPGDTGDTGESEDTGPDPDTGDSWICEPIVNDSPTRVVFDFMKNQNWADCKKQLVKEEILGIGKMEGGQLLFTPGGADCIGQPVVKLRLGTGYPGPDRAFCGKFIIDWVDDADNCEIAAFTFLESTQNGPKYLYGRYHSPALDPGNTPFTPVVLKPGSCGCPPIDPFCCELEPGQHSVVVGRAEVAPDETKMISGDFLFTNFNTIMPPECRDDPSTPAQLDWFAVSI